MTTRLRRRTEGARQPLVTHWRFRATRNEVDNGVMGDKQVALEKYRRLARRYDFLTGWEKRYRRRTVTRLGLQPGDMVLDVACGTGINFDQIQADIGPQGKLIGLDLSPDMLQQARHRVQRNGWKNVLLIEGAAQEADLPPGLDAVLFSLTHDVLQSDAALNNVFAATMARARIAAYGPKWAPRWAVPVNWGVRLVASRFVTTFEGFDRPFAKLETFVSDLEVEVIVFGGAYIAWGRTRPA